MLRTGKFHQNSLEHGHMPASGARHFISQLLRVLFADGSYQMCLLSLSAKALPRASPFKEWSKTGYKNTPCLYFRLTLSGNSQSRAPMGVACGLHCNVFTNQLLPLLPSFQYSHLNTVIMHINLPLESLSQVTRFKTVDIESRPRNKMLKWSFGIPRWPSV